MFEGGWSDHLGQVGVMGQENENRELSFSFSDGRSLVTRKEQCQWVRGRIGGRRGD